MAQTAKPFATLETELADNTAKDISPLRLRNFLESALGCYGAMHIDGGSTAEVLTASATKITGWLTAGLAKNTTPDPTTNDELTLSVDGIWLVCFSCSFLVTAATDRFKFELRNNDVQVPGFASDVSGTLGDRVVCSWSNVGSFVASDDLTVYATAIGGLGDATLEHAQLTATRVG